MTILRAVVRIELAVLVVCFAAVLGLQFLRCAVRWAKQPKTRKALSGLTGALRLQMLAASLVIAVLYLAGLPRSAASGNLPPVPEYALALLAVSQLVFLAAMVQRLLRPISILTNEGER